MYINLTSINVNTNTCNKLDSTNRTFSLNVNVNLFDIQKQDCRDVPGNPIQGGNSYVDGTQF